MKELKPRIHENGIDYILVGDYYVPDWKLPEEKRPVGHWGRLHQAYLRMYRPGLYSELVLSCKLHTYLADKRIIDFDFLPAVLVLVVTALMLHKTV